MRIMDLSDSDVELRGRCERERERERERADFRPVDGYILLKVRHLMTGLVR